MEILSIVVDINHNLVGALEEKSGIIIIIPVIYRVMVLSKHRLSYYPAGSIRTSLREGSFMLIILLFVSHVIASVLQLRTVSGNQGLKGPPPSSPPSSITNPPPSSIHS